MPKTALGTHTTVFTHRSTRTHTHTHTHTHTNPPDNFHDKMEEEGEERAGCSGREGAVRQCLREGNRALRELGRGRARAVSGGTDGWRRVAPRVASTTTPNTEPR